MKSCIRLQENADKDTKLRETQQSAQGAESAAAARFFRDRYYPNATSTPASSAGATNDNKFAGGVFANARVNATNYATIGVHFLGGDGVGRYGTAGLSDATVHPDGTLEPLHAYQGLFSLELHPTPKLDLFAYVGGEYVQRALYVNSKGQQVGYAPHSPNNSGCCTRDCRAARRPLRRGPARP